jgi:hypothetical protein
MTNPIIRIHNIETDEILDREMTDSEFNQYKKEEAAEAERLAQVQVKAQAKAALLAQLGITEEQAKLLLS